MTTLSLIPNEIIYEISSFMSFHDLINFRITCSLVNQIGLRVLNSKTTLVSAFWIFCQFMEFQWIKLDQMHDKSDFKIFYHSEDSLPFVAISNTKTSPKLKQLRFNRSQLHFCCESKKLKIDFKLSNLFVMKSLSFDLISKDVKILDVVQNKTINNAKVLTVPFNCFQPPTHHFYYGSGFGYNYYYDVDGSPSTLMFSVSNMCRIVKATNLTSHSIHVCFVLCNLFVFVLIDFETKSLKFENIYRISSQMDTDFDSDICLFGDKMIQWEEILPLRLESLQPYDVLDYSFVDK